MTMRSAVLVLFLSFVVASNVAACDYLTQVIPDVTFDWDYPVNMQYSLTWSAPQNAPPGTQYNVELTLYPYDYCSLPSPIPNTPPTYVYSTTARTFVGTYPTANRLWTVGVRVAGSNCFASSFLADSYTTLQPKPVFNATAGNGSVTLSNYTPNNGQRSSLRIERLGTDGQFHQIGYGSDLDYNAAPGSHCANPLPFVDYGPGGSSDTGGQLQPGNYTYRLRARNLGTVAGKQGVYSDPVTVSVGSPGVIVDSFTVTPSTIAAGQEATLSWSVRNASGATINGTPQQPTGAMDVTPAATTTYALTASGTSSTSSSSVTLSVVQAPVLMLVSSSSGMMQTPGAQATDSVTVMNAGGSATDVTVNQTGSFFTVSPTSFHLEPRASQVISVTGIQQSGDGVAQGSLSLSAPGVSTPLVVPVKLMTLSAPSGPVTADAAQSRVAVSGYSGSATFTNNGTSTLNGMLMSDAPWLVPQDGMVSIPPGGSTAVTFTIDSSKRPDPSAAGSSTATMSLVYGKSGGASSTSSSGVSVTSLAAPFVSGSVIPPLSPNDTTITFPGLEHRGAAFSDLLLYNRGPGAALHDVQIYFSRPDGTSTQVASLNSVAPSVPVPLADVIKGVFRNDATAGMLQLRSAQVQKLLATAIDGTAGSWGFVGGSVTGYPTSVAAAAGEQIVLPGLRKDAGGRTDLYIQEVAGLAASVHTDFLSASGTVVASRDDALTPFKFIEITDAAPSGAATAVLTISSSAAGRIVARGSVVDLGSDDRTEIADWNRRNGIGGADERLIPIIRRATGTHVTRTELIVTNTGSGEATASLHFPGRKRGVRRNGTSTNGDVSTPITLGARQSLSIPDLAWTAPGSSGEAESYATFKPVSGTFAIEARIVEIDPGKPYVSTSVPVLPMSAGLRQGQSRQFASLEDASPARVAARAPYSLRAKFGLVETSNAVATVRVTLQYIRGSGGLAGLYATSTRTFDVTPGQFLEQELGSIIGASRAAAGDLHDVTLTIEVIRGSGTVVPFVMSTDASTYDSILRLE